MDRSPNPKVFDSNPYRGDDIIPADALTPRMQSGRELLSKLHKICPPLNGVCVEALLYLALRKYITIDASITEQFNYNAIYNVDITTVPYCAKQVGDFIKELDYHFSCMCPEFQCANGFTFAKVDTSKFVLTKVDPTKSSDKANEIILYLAVYAYLHVLKHPSKEKEPFSNAVIFDYCQLLMDSTDSFKGLFEYVEAIAVNLITANPLNSQHKFIADVPIREFTTKNYRVGGNVDLLAVPINSGSGGSVWIYDCKCCGSDEYNKGSKWPRQLNLYARGLAEDYAIEGLCIVNVYTNRLFQYNPVVGFATAELD